MQDAYTIFPAYKPQSWSVARITASECRILPVPEASGMACPAKTVLDVLQSLGYQGEATLLALPSQACLCATIEESGLRYRGRETARQFRLEAQLPLAIEDVAVDFACFGAQSLGVAVPIDLAEPLIDALEAQGIVVASVCPTAVLITDQVNRASQNSDKIDAVLSALDGHLDLMLLQHGQIHSWTHLPPQLAALKPHLSHARLTETEPLRLCAIGLTSELETELTAMDSVKVLKKPIEDSLTLAARAAARILSGNAQPTVELRRGKLAARDPIRHIRVPLHSAVAAALVVLLVLAISMFWRAHQYDRVTQLAEARQLQAFQQALPNQTPPSILTSRLLSEERKLQGLSGATSVLPPTLSVLPLLRDTLAALPKDLRFRLQELRFEPQRIYLEGQTLDHGSADRIAAALRQATGLQVDPPHTEQPAGEDVTFTISASAVALAQNGEASR